MRVAILCFDDPGTALGGVESYSAYLSSLLPGSTIISGRSVPFGWRGWCRHVPGFSHPAAAYRIASYFTEKLAPEFDCAIAAGMIGWHFRFTPPPCPVITVFHGNYAAYTRAARGEPRLQRLRGALLWSKCEQWAGRGSICVSVSESVQEQVWRYYRHKSYLVYNAVDPSLFRPVPRAEALSTLGWKSTARYALFVGRPTPSKGFDLVVNAAKHLSSFTFVCAVPGDPPAGEFPANLRFVTRVPREMLPHIYCASDFLLAPSRYEGCALSPIEAMACNIPIITSRTGFFLDKRFSRLPGGVHVLKELTLDEISSAIRAERSGHSGLREYVGAHFAPETFRQSYLSLLSQARATRSCGSIRQNDDSK